MVAVLQPGGGVAHFHPRQAPQPASGDVGVVNVGGAVEPAAAEVGAAALLALPLVKKMMVGADQPQVVQVDLEGGVVAHPGAGCGAGAAVVVAQDGGVCAEDELAVQAQRLVNLPAVAVLCVVGFLGPHRHQMEAEGRGHFDRGAVLD